MLLMENTYVIEPNKLIQPKQTNRNSKEQKVSIITQDSSDIHVKIDQALPTINEKKDTVPEVSRSNSSEQSSSEQNFPQKEKNIEREEMHIHGVSRSILEFEKNRKRICDKIIRSETDNQRMNYFGRPGERVIIVQDNPIICSTDLYLKEQIGWTNRKIKVLTTQQLADTPFSDIIKIKVKSEQPMLRYYIFRITTKDETLKEYAIRQSCMRHWFANSVWAYLLQKGIETSINQHFKDEYSGWILKKSEILGRWERRFVRIVVGAGLQSSHSEEDKPTIEIGWSSEVWTRFEIISYEEQQFIVVKLWQRIIKREFALPVSSCISWLKAFSSLVLQKKQ